jgi:hypothetical protein
MPGDPELLDNGGLCVVEWITIMGIDEASGNKLVPPKVAYDVAVPGHGIDDTFGSELLPVEGSKFFEYPDE